MALDRATLTRILDVRERNAIVALAHHGRGDDARRIAARELGLSRDSFDGLVASAETKITRARMRLAEGYDEAPEPRPIEEAALDAAQDGVGQEIHRRPRESVERERQNGDRPVHRYPNSSAAKAAAPEVVELLRERGPMRQADLLAVMDIAGPTFSSYVLPTLLREHGVTKGERVANSYVLRLPEHVDSDPGSGQDMEVRQPSNRTTSEETAGPDADPFQPVRNVHDHDVRVHATRGQWIQAPLDAPDCEFCGVPPGRKHVAVVSPASSAGTAAGSPSRASDDGATKQADAPADDTPVFTDETQPEWGIGGPAESANGTAPPKPSDAAESAQPRWPPFAGIEGEEAAWHVLIPPEGEEERQVMYLGILFERLQQPDCPEHVYDRIERMIGVMDGAPREPSLT